MIVLLTLMAGITLGLAVARSFQQSPQRPSPIRDETLTKLSLTLHELEGSDEVPSSTENLLDRLDSIARNIHGRYEVLTTNLAAAVIVYDEDWQVRFASPYTEVLTGYSPDEFYSSEADLFELIAVEGDGEKIARAKQVCRLGEEFHLQYQIKHRSSILLWVDGRFVPIFNEADEVIGMLSVTIDVTESIRQRKQLEQQNQDLSDFSYMVSHDLKAPIFTIKGMVAALQEDYGDKLGEEGGQLLAYITEGAQRLEKLVSSVIEYSAISIKEGTILPVQLKELMHSVMQDLSEQLRITGGKVSLSEALPSVSGDPVRIYQVFSNLLGNAIKYRSPERVLEVNIRARVLPNDFVQIEVEDNGRGIPEGKIKDIFRPYHRAHSSEIEGSGIGLASVKKIVEKAGGQVSVESVEGKGSTFKVILPLAKSPIIKHAEEARV